MRAFWLVVVVLNSFSAGVQAMAGDAVWFTVGALFATLGIVGVLKND